MTTRKHESPAGVTRRARGALRRQELVEAAAAIIREEGPAAVSHRAVAKRVGCSLSATTYYFTGLDEMLAEAGRINIQMWARRAEQVADEVENAPPPSTFRGVTNAILQACLPPNEMLSTHYLQLLEAATTAPVAHAYADGRARLDDAIERVLQRIGISVPPALVVAVVDGAAVSALSEGRDVRETAHELLQKIL
ncbi:MAG: TetR family transcriptional regulator [Bowdeniella nasicola]|nr:TetR family transcriptional regulator [Bowdeniella nasicola]